MTQRPTLEQNAAEAFEALRRDVTILAAAIGGLIAEREKMPDYDPTLAEIRQLIDECRAGVGAIARQPAVALTPASLAREINKAAEATRTEDRRMLDTARSALDQTVGRIEGVVKRGQDVAIQRERIIQTAYGALAAGILLWSFLPGLVARSLPESWHVPEWMAARTMRMETKDAGERMIAIASGRSEG